MWKPKPSLTWARIGLMWLHSAFLSLVLRYTVLSAVGQGVVSLAIGWQLWICLVFAAVSTGISVFRTSSAFSQSCHDLAMLFATLVIQIPMTSFITRERVDLKCPWRDTFSRKGVACRGTLDPLRYYCGARAFRLSPPSDCVSASVAVAIMWLDVALLLASGIYLILAVRRTAGRYHARLGLARRHAETLLWKTSTDVLLRKPLRLPEHMGTHCINVQTPLMTRKSEDSIVGEKLDAEQLPLSEASSDAGGQSVTIPKGILRPSGQAETTRDTPLPQVTLLTPTQSSQARPLHFTSSDSEETLVDPAERPLSS